MINSSMHLMIRRAYNTMYIRNYASCIQCHVYITIFMITESDTEQPWYMVRTSAIHALLNPCLV